MTAGALERPVALVEPPQKTLSPEKRRWGAFLVARDALQGVLEGARALTSNLRRSLRDNRLMIYAARALGWAWRGASQVWRISRLPGVRSAVAWSLLTRPGAAVVSAVSAAVVRTAVSLLRPLAGAASWLLRRCGHVGVALERNLRQLVSSAGAQIATTFREVSEVLASLLKPNGLVHASVRNILGARAVNGLVRSVVPRPWGLLARALINLAAIPASARGYAAALWRRLLSRADEPLDPTPPTSPDPQGNAGSIVQMKPTRSAERPSAEEVSVVAVSDIEPDIVAIENMQRASQRYPAKKAAGKRRR